MSKIKDSLLYPTKVCKEKKIRKNSREKTKHSGYKSPKLSIISNIKIHSQRRNQDGRVEGCALTPSCENTRITTSCWTIIDRKTLEFTKKDTPHPKTKEKPQ